MKRKHKKGIKPLDVDLPEVALNSPTTIEYLPYTKVHYPNHYGIFITFSSYSEGVHYFCECAKASIDNYLILHKLIDADGLVKSNWGFNHAFSNYITKRTQIKVPYDTVFKYKPALCHKCNLTSPNLRWCHEMYGGNFMQYFGWYVQQAKYKFGINDVDIQEDKCSEEVIELVKSLTSTGTTKIKINEEGDGYDYSEYKTVRKALDNYAEDVTRQEFGFCKIGKGWVSESILFNVIKKLFPSETIIRRHRPQWLNGLEIDIFIPSISLGFEYQGHQHFYEVGGWGGDSGLKNVQKRDKLKKDLCLKNCVSLITIDFTEPLIEKYILAKITSHNNSITSD